MLVKWQNPRNLFNLNDVDQAFDNFFNNRGHELKDQEISPRINVEENDNEWLISAELPGVAKEDIRLKALNGWFNLSAQRGQMDYAANQNWGKEIVPEKTTAKYNNGLLSITAFIRNPSSPKGLPVRKCFLSKSISLGLCFKSFSHFPGAPNQL